MSRSRRDWDRLHRHTRVTKFRTTPKSPAPIGAIVEKLVFQRTEGYLLKKRILDWLESTTFRFRGYSCRLGYTYAQFCEANRLPQDQPSSKTAFKETVRPFLADYQKWMDSVDRCAIKHRWRNGELHSSFTYEGPEFECEIDDYQA